MKSFEEFVIFETLSLTYDKKMAKKKNRDKIKKSPKVKVGVSKNKENLTPIIAVLVVTALVFANCLSNDFVNWDDPLNLLENRNLDGFTFDNIKNIFTTTIIGNYNPLPIFMFAIEKAIFGLKPFVFHFNNLLLHLGCTFLVYKIMIEMKLSPTAAALGALLFGIHPMRVESVAWVTERKDVLFGIFYLGAMLTYIYSLKKPAESRKWLVYTFVLFVFSCFSKIQAVSLPLSMLVLDYYFKKPLKLNLLLEKIPFFAISLLTGLAGLFFLGADGSLDDKTNYTIVERLLTGAYSYSVYIVKWVFPYEMSPLYPYAKKLPTVAYFGPIGVVLAAGLFYWFFKKGNRAAAFAIAFFTVNIMFVLQVVGAGQGYLADRFTYISYFGLFFLTAYYFDFFTKKYPQKKQVFYGVGGVYLLLFAFMTFNQNKIWKNGETLWTHASECYPKTHTPYQNRGKFYQKQGKTELAFQDFNKSVETALEKDIPLNSRGKIYFDKGQLDKAFADFDAAVKSGTKHGEIYINRGSAHAQSGRMNEAYSDFNKGIELDPEFRSGYLMRSLYYQSTGNFEAAFNDLKKAIALNRNDSKAQYEAGMCLNRLGRSADALDYFNSAIRTNPRVATYYSERARAHQALGNNAAAQADMQKAGR